MARLNDQSSGSSQLEHVLFIVLQGGHLSAEERLACFCSNKSMAKLVLRHAACTCLSLTLPEAFPAATATAGNQATTAGEATAHAEAVQQLAAHSDNVTLALHGGMLKPAACLWQCITTIQLHGIQLDQTSGIQLQLHELPRLHTLSLRQCRLAPSSSSSSSQQHRSTNVRTLECLNCPDDQPLSVALQWVDPSQLQTVTTDNAAATTLLPQLPALQELRISKHPIAEEHSTIDDEGFQRLLAHPRLARVRLNVVQLSHSHADKLCAWDSLHLTHGIDLEHLACMPLAGMQSCMVHGKLEVQDSDTLAAAISTITHAKKLVFQRHSRSFLMTFATPNNHLSAQVVTLVLRNLAPETVLMVHGLNVGAPEVRASLAAAPATLTTAFFGTIYSEDVENAEDEEATGPGVLTHMPHVGHLVLCKIFTPEATAQARWLETLRLFVAGVTRPLILALTMHRRTQTGQRQEAEWQVSDQEEIRQWVATHASEHVKVYFR